MAKGRKVRLVAAGPLEYEGRPLRTNTVFSANEEDVKRLLADGHKLHDEAEKIHRGGYLRRDMRAEK